MVCAMSNQFHSCKTNMQLLELHTLDYPFGIHACLKFYVSNGLYINVQLYMRENYFSNFLGEQYKFNVRLVDLIANLEGLVCYRF